jgi:hypothetical protein
VQRSHPIRCHLRARRQRALQRPAAFVPIALIEPEAPDRRDQPKLTIGVTAADEILERGPKVVVLVLDPSRPGNPAFALELRGCVFGEREEVPGVASALRLGVVGLLEALEGVLPDRLEHRKVLIRAAHEVLVDERLQRVEAGAADRLGRGQRPAASENARRANSARSPGSSSS